ncbi:hypothetical protein BC833DRAFT_592301 [Globomyces pollinis-pini]|nr:hypothetical protein BC833DRAFT_592301 [Globomyces pollinis-pini]
MNTKPTSSNYQPFVQQWNGDVAVHSEPSYHQSGAYDNQPRVYRAETYNPPNQFSRNSEMTPILSKSLYGKEYYETDRPIQSYYDQRLQSNSESHPNVSSRNISPQNQKNPNFQQNPSEESHHSSIIQPLFLFTEYGFSGESLDLVLNYFYPLSTRLNAVDDYIDQNIKIHLGDVLMIEEHLKNGFCRGHNITQQTAGYFPLKILLPNSTIPFRFIDCYKQKSTVIGKPLPSIIKYLMEFNPPLLTINSIDMEKITESDLYPIFSTLKGDEKCLVHGEQEFTEFMMYFLKVFGDGFWKSLDISQLT